MRQKSKQIWNFSFFPSIFHTIKVKGLDVQVRHQGDLPCFVVKQAYSPVDRMWEIKSKDGEWG